MKVNDDGCVDVNEFQKLITKDTLMASIMMVNNETGSIQDMDAISSICKDHKIILHSDCAQAFGKLPIDVSKMNIDLMSISGHKI